MVKNKHYQKLRNGKKHEKKSFNKKNKKLVSKANLLIGKKKESSNKT